MGGGARLQCGIREWAGTSSSVGTWQRPTNLGLGVVEAGPSRTIRSPKRTVREAGCYSTILYGGHAAEIDPEPCKITSDFYDQNWSYNYPSEVLMNNALGKCSLELTNQKFPTDDRRAPLIKTLFSSRKCLDFSTVVLLLLFGN